MSSSVSGTASSGGRGDRHVEVDGRAVLGIDRADAGRRPARPSRHPARRSARSRAGSSARRTRARCATCPSPACASVPRSRSPAATARPRGTRRRRAAVRLGSVSRGMTSRNSTIEPGQPCVSSSGSASVVRRARVDEVDRLPVDVGAEVGELVQARLLRAPVVRVAPVRHQLAQVVDRDPVLPAGVLDLVGEAGLREAVAQVVEDRVVDVDRGSARSRDLGLGAGPRSSASSCASSTRIGVPFTSTCRTPVGLLGGQALGVGREVAHAPGRARCRPSSGSNTHTSAQ